MVKREPSDSAAAKFAIIQEIEEGKLGYGGIIPGHICIGYVNYFRVTSLFATCQKKACVSRKMSV